MSVRKMRWSVKGFPVAGGLLALGAGGAVFLLRPTPVTVTEVAVRDITPAIHGVGTVEAKKTVQVGAKISGRLVSILADQGDTVKTGQILAQLEDAERVAEVQQAEATLQRARLGVAAQEAAVRKAGATVAAAEAAVSRARATETLARINAERWRQLHTEGGVARVDMDIRVMEAAVAADELKNVEAQRLAAGEEVAALHASLEMARHEIRAAEAALATTRARQADTVLVSPLNGYVVSRELEPGATVNPGTPILRIADPRTAWVTVYVDERDTGNIAVGDPADIALRSLPGRTLRGRIARIQRESDRVTEQLAVDITFDERPPRLTLGEQAEAIIRPAGRHGVLAFPLAALVRTPDGLGTWVVVNGLLQFRTLRPGVIDPSGWVEVVEGLHPGERVVVAPGRLADQANEGRRVVARLTDGRNVQTEGRR